MSRLESSRCQNEKSHVKDIQSEPTRLREDQTEPSRLWQILKRAGSSRIGVKTNRREFGRSQDKPVQVEDIQSESTRLSEDETEPARVEAFKNETTQKKLFVLKVQSTYHEEAYTIRLLMSRMASCQRKRVFALLTMTSCWRFNQSLTCHVIVVNNSRKSIILHINNNNNANKAKRGVKRWEMRGRLVSFEALQAYDDDVISRHWYV